MSPLLIKSQWRYLRTRWWLALISILGIAVGVAGPVSMDLTIASCRRAFELSTEAVSGRATHSIQPSGDSFAEGIYPRLRLELGIHKAAPVVEGAVSLTSHGKDHTLRVLGLDPFVEGDFRGQLGLSGTAGPAAAAMLSVSGTGLISRQQARELGLKQGDKIELLGGAHLTIAGLLDTPDARSAQALEGLVLVDIATAQELLGKVGQLSRIDLILTNAADEERVRSILPPGLELVAVGQRSLAMRQMTSAFFLNLQALSMLSLLVGALLVYNVSRFLVVERRPLLGRLRTLGVTDRELLTLIVGECLLLSLAGIVLGELVGIALARVLLTLVARTINDLYYATEISRVELDQWVLLKGFALGSLASLVAVWAPARAATRAPIGQGLSRSSFFEENQRWVERAGLLGAALWLGGWALLVGAGHSLALSLVAVLLTILGMACLTPWAVKWLNRGVLRICRGRLPILARLAISSIERDLDWTGVALATLTIAISATISIGLMVFSFRQSLMVWLEQTLQADVYVGLVDRNAAKAGKALPPELVRALQKLDGVSQWSLLRISHAQVGDLRVNLFGISVAAKAEVGYRLTSGPKTAWRDFHAGELFISEPFAYRNHLDPGAVLRLDTPTGLHEARVAAVFSDYTSETGYVMVDRKYYQRWFQDDQVSGMAAFLKDGVSVQSVLQQISALPGGGTVEAHSNRSLRELSVEIFERTFQVTAILRYLAVLVALCGIFGALAALQLARQRDLALYRALGLTWAQGAGLQLLQTTVAGLWAGLFAVPAGLGEAYAMVVFINRRAFGWNLTFGIDPRLLMQAPEIALAASLLAGVLTIGLGLRSRLSTRLQED